MCWYLTAPHDLLPPCPQPLHHDVEVPQGLILLGLHDLTAEAETTGDLVRVLHVHFDLGRLVLIWLDYVFTVLTSPILTILLLPVVA